MRLPYVLLFDVYVLVHQTDLSRSSIFVISISSQSKTISQMRLVFSSSIIFLELQVRDSSTCKRYALADHGYWLVGVYLCSFFCNRRPRMTWPPIFLGTLVEAIGVGMLAWAMYRQHTATIFGMMALVGVGTGLRYMAAPLHGVGHFRKHRAAVIGLLAVAIPLGGTIGLTIMSTVFNNTSGLDYDDDFSHIRDQAPETMKESKRMAKVRAIFHKEMIIS